MTTATVTRPSTTTTSDLIVAEFTKDIDTALTVKSLMDATRKSRTTVTDNLRVLAAAGTVVRLDKDGVTTWSLTPTRKAAIRRAARKVMAAANKPAVKVTKASARKATSKAKGTTVTTDNTPARTDTGRRRKGEIDFEIRGWFEANDNTPAGSYAVAKAIGSRSGAAYVALRRMDREGKANLVSSEPDRYSINFDAEAWNVTDAE